MKLRLPKIKTLTRVSFFLLCVSLTAQIVITNKYAVKGGEMAALLTQQENLEEEISELKLQISKASSLAYIATQAQEMGFQEYNQSMAVISSSQFAAATAGTAL